MNDRFSQVRVYAKAVIALSRGKINGEAEIVVAAMRFLLVMAMHGVVCWEPTCLCVSQAQNLAKLGMKGVLISY